MKKTSIILIVLTILGKIIGFGREITLSYYFGTSYITDAYLISQSIPMVIFSLIGSALAIGYIPLYSGITDKRGFEEGNKFTSNLINWTNVLSTVIVIFTWIYTKEIVNVFAPGFDDSTSNLTILFTRISVISIYFTGGVNILQGYLQLQGSYFIPALIGIPLNIIILLSIVFSGESQKLLILSIGSVIALFSQLTLLWTFSKRKGYKHRLGIQVKDENIHKLVKMSIPLILGGAVYQINTVIDSTMVSFVALGGIASMNYGNKIITFVQSIFVLPLTTIMYPLITKMASKNELQNLKNHMLKTINAVNLMIIPTSIGILILAKPVIELLFGRGSFGVESTNMTSQALFYLCFGLVSNGHREVLSRVFYALKDTRTPMFNSVLALILNIILNVVLSSFMGIGGIALATSLSSTFCVMLLIISLRKKIGKIDFKKIMFTFSKTLFSSLIMGVFVNYVYKYLIQTHLLITSLSIAITLGALLYIVLICYMRIDEVSDVLKEIQGIKSNFSTKKTHQ